MLHENGTLSFENRRENILSFLDELVKKYPDYENDIEDLKFDFEEKQLLI